MSELTHYEYKRCYNPNSYLMNELSAPGHKFGYVKRRNMKYNTSYTGFKPFCTCKTKIFKTWHFNKDKALQEFNKHAKDMLENHPPLEIG